ncbi:MAG: hypothetical protein AAB276_01075, partial [Pseudomonadota bacterium]
LSECLRIILTNPLENFKAAQRGDVKGNVPYVILVVQVLLLPVSIILSSLFGLSLVLKGITSGILSIFL